MSDKIFSLHSCDDPIPNDPPAGTFLLKNCSVDLQNKAKSLLEIFLYLFKGLPLRVHPWNFLNPAEVPLSVLLIDSSALHMSKEYHKADKIKTPGTTGRFAAGARGRY